MADLPLSLSEASGVPYYRQIEDQLADLIRAGRLKPGDRLPSVRALAADLLVSLITIRRAYGDLETDGLIVRRQGDGTFVADDVAAASQARARREGERILEASLRRAEQLGLDVDAQREVFDRVWGSTHAQGGSHE